MTSNTTAVKRGYWSEVAARAGGDSTHAGLALKNQVILIRRSRLQRCMALCTWPSSDAQLITTCLLFGVYRLHHTAFIEWEKKKVFLLAGAFPHSVLSAWYIRGGLLQATNQMLVFWSLILHGGISHCGFTVWCQWLIKGKVRFILLIMYQWWWATQLWSLVACKLFGTVKPNTLPRVMGIFLTMIPFIFKGNFTLTWFAAVCNFAY